MPRIRAIAIVLGLLAFCQPSHAADDALACRRQTPPVPAGFAPPTRTDFAPILELVSPGPRRAERAMEALDRQLIFQRQVLHPEYSPALKQLFEKIPPRNSTLIRAASMYSRADIPWIKLDETHQLCAEGYPSGEKFYVTTSLILRKTPSSRFAWKPISHLSRPRA